ncbi:MAG: 2'-5' RNA ligase family protein [Anaerolineaceae bacterium]|nr:2'-5' RNA ligase family protein [Anaerolineaceae bacterium]
MIRSKRAIVIFPKFENSLAIELLRNRYDPLALTIAPHITLVFPFESTLSTPQLQTHIQQAIQGMQPFPVQLHGISGSESEYLFLNVKRGNDELIELHDRLYSGILSEHLRIEQSYIPHLTVGRLNDPAAFLAALETAQMMKSVFHTITEELVVYRVNDNDPIEAVIRL